MQGPDKLLVFAHRPEAQSFLKNDKLTMVTDEKLNLYQHEDYFLLISGEGILNSLQLVSTILAKFPHIKEVWNLGIAGGLDQASLKLDHIYKIRTCYAELGEEIQFKSYTSAFKKSLFDCLSSTSRILDEKKADQLSNFAPIVDRECWGIARACQEFKVPFYPVKLISDFPIEGNKEICSIVKEKAEIYSDQLYRWWSVNQTQPSSKEEQINYSHFFNDFYFTVSMERNFNKYFQTLLKNKNDCDFVVNEIKNHPEYLEILDKKQTRKQQTLELIDLLRKVITPELLSVESHLQLMTRELKRTGAKVSFDPTLEESFIHLNMKLSNDRDKDNFINALKRFSFEKLNQVLEGKDLD